MKSTLPEIFGLVYRFFWIYSSLQLENGINNMEIVFLQKIIRYYKGSTDVNQGIRDVLTKEPDKFFYYNNGIKATPLGDRLTALHAIFRQIFRHFRQNLLEIRQYSCVDFVNLTKNYARNLTHNLCAVLP